jgi:hypothetical protein
MNIIALADTGGGRRGVRSRGWAGWGVCELRLRLVDARRSEGSCAVCSSHAVAVSDDAGETFQLRCTKLDGRDGRLGHGRKW